MKGKLLFAGLAIFALFFTISSAQAQAKKEAVDLLVTGATIVTMDADRHVWEDGSIAIKGDSIVAIGPAQGLLGQYEAPQTIDAKGKLIIPGLINGHTHIPMVLMRGLIDDVT